MAIAGHTGTIDLGAKLDSDTAYNTHSWSIDVAADTFDITKFSAKTWKLFLAGLKGWTGSAALYTDVSYRIPPSDVGSEVTGRFYYNATVGLTGKCIISGWHPAVSVDGVETQTVDLQGSSDLFTF